jgi:hypothetical protein
MFKRVPLMPCYISCNTHPTLPHSGTALALTLATRLTGELLQIPAWGEATEVGSMSSTSGCITMGGGSIARSLWYKLRHSDLALLVGAFD